MKPISAWDDFDYGYKFKDKTFYSSEHLGLDIMCPIGTKIYAPFEGKAEFAPFVEGGKVVNFYSGDYVFRFMHLDKVVATGLLSEGDLFAISGDSGSYCNGAHLHIDISKNSVKVNNINNFIDPLYFNWEGKKKMNKEKLAKLLRRIWIELSYNYDQNPDMVSILSEAESMIENDTDWGENLITKWSNEGIRKKLKDTEKITSSLMADIAGLKKNVEKRNAVLSCNSIDLLKIKGEILTITKALKEITTLLNL